MGRVIRTVGEWSAWLERFENQPDYRKPLAFGIGMATVSGAGEILDTFFPLPNYQQNFGIAAVMAEVVGHKSGTASYELEVRKLSDMLDYFHPFNRDGKVHKNIDTIKAVLSTVVGSLKVATVSFIDQPEHDPGPQTVSDAYLHLWEVAERGLDQRRSNYAGRAARTSARSHGAELPALRDRSGQVPAHGRLRCPKWRPYRRRFACATRRLSGCRYCRDARRFL